jgi:methyl coenzyme M reductase beta subunit
MTFIYSGDSESTVNLFGKVYKRETKHHLSRYTIDGKEVMFWEIKQVSKDEISIEIMDECFERTIEIKNLKQMKQEQKEYKFTKMMTLKEWKQFAKNYDPTFSKTNLKDNSGISLKDYMLTELYTNNFNNFICYAFEWGRTKEKFNYWLEISKRTKHVS